MTQPTISYICPGCNGRIEIADDRVTAYDSLDIYSTRMRIETTIKHVGMPEEACVDILDNFIKGQHLRTTEALAEITGSIMREDPSPDSETRMRGRNPHPE